MAASIERDNETGSPSPERADINTPSSLASAASTPRLSASYAVAHPSYSSAARAAFPVLASNSASSPMSWAWWFGES